MRAKPKTHNKYGMPIVAAAELMTHNLDVLTAAGCAPTPPQAGNITSCADPAALARAAGVINAAKRRGEYLTYSEISQRVGKTKSWLCSAILKERYWALDLQVEADELVRFADLEHWRSKGRAIPHNLKPLLAARRAS
jgi:hypothetical protein